LAFGAVFVATFVLALLVAGTRQQASLSRTISTYNPSPTGMKALVVTLQKLGWSAERWQHPWTKLGSQRGILVYTEPYPEEFYNGQQARPGTPEEITALTHWITRGNTLLYYTNPERRQWRSEEKLLEELHVDLRTNVDTAAEIVNYWSGQRRSRTVRDITPVQFTEGVHTIVLEQNSGFRVVSGAAVPLVAGADGVPHAVWVPYGRGQVVLFSSASFIDNEFLAQGDNLTFLLDLLRDLPAGGTILFDEYHHGYSSEFALHDFLVLPVVKFAALQLALVAALVLYSQARRFGEPVPLVHETRRSVMEYAVALGDLYRRADTQLETLEYLYQHVRRELIDRHGLGTAATAAVIAARLGARAELRRAWEELANDCEQRLEQRRLTRREFALLARRLQEFRRQMQ